MPVAIPAVLLLSLFASSGRGCIPTRTPEYIVDQEMWQELEKQATTSVLLTTVRDTTASSTSPSSAAPTTTTTTTTSTTTSTTTTSTTSTTTTTPFPCPTTPAAWSYNPTNGHCYYVSNSGTISWQIAENNCQSYATDGHLASIADQDENDFILRTESWYWIGLQQPGNSNTFQSTGSWTDNSMYDYINGYSNWFVILMMPTYALCAKVRGLGSANEGRWATLDCSQPAPYCYICEAPANQ